MPIAEVLKEDPAEPLPVSVPHLLTPSIAEDHRGPRLLIDKLAPNVCLDGVDKTLSPQEYRLLLLLAEKVIAGGRTAENREIEAQIWGDSLHRIARPVRDVVRELRHKLAAGASDAAAARAIIKNWRSPNGYRLTLTPEQIEIRQ